MKKSAQEQLHEAMHRIPGVPEHSEAKNLNNRGGLQNRPYKNRQRGAQVNHPARQPKVLIGWQKKVAKFFGTEIK